MVMTLMMEADKLAIVCCWSFRNRVGNIGIGRIGALDFVFGIENARCMVLI